MHAQEWIHVFHQAFWLGLFLLVLSLTRSIYAMLMANIWSWCWFLCLVLHKFFDHYQALLTGACGAVGRCSLSKPWVAGFGHVTDGGKKGRKHCLIRQRVTKDVQFSLPHSFKSLLFFKLLMCLLNPSYMIPFPLIPNAVLSCFSLYAWNLVIICTSLIPVRHWFGSHCNQDLYFTHSIPRQIHLYCGLWSFEFLTIFWKATSSSNHEQVSFLAIHDGVFDHTHQYDTIWGLYISVLGALFWILGNWLPCTLYLKIELPVLRVC